MKIFTRPYWIFLTVTLPQSLIVFYYLGIYSIISSLLEPRHLDHWILYGAILSGLIVAASAYAAFLQIRRQSITWLYALVSLIVYVVFLYVYLEHATQLLPFSIPRWMIPSEEAFVLPIGLIMPVLIHSLLLLVDRVTPDTKKHSLLKATIAAFAIPAFWYLVIRFGFPLMQGRLAWELHRHVQEVTFIILTVAFMFLSMRLAYLLIQKVPQTGLRNIWLMRVPFTILLPLLALLAYNGMIGGWGGDWLAELKLIGDWSHPAYYALAFINGVLLTLPSAQQAMVRLGSFAAKALFYPLVAYFFIVFLPFFPLAVNAAIVGIGFLLLAPLLLFFFHTRSLHDDWRVLGERYGWKVPLLVFLPAFAVLPVGLTFTYSMDRITLNTMLAHVYEPDYSSAAAPHLDMDSARRVLDNIRTVKKADDIFSSDRKPYLTTYYQWLVLDNLTLSDSRLSNLERIFLGSPALEDKSAPTAASANDGTRITKVASTTQLSDDGRFYNSQVELTITHDGANIGEYATRFRFPPGAWIQDYYLIINGKKIPGILAEKKSALWVYQQIRDTRRDPGIIYYTSPDELILRVFPFSKDESRQTGFTVIHREPVTLQIDDSRVNLSTQQPLPITRRQDDGAESFVVVSPAEKAALPKHQRKPYLHFIVDRSSNAAQHFDAYRERIGKIVAGRQLYGVDMAGAMITVANYADLTFPLDKDWSAKAQRFVPAGGFFLEHAVKRALYANYRQQADSYPVFVVVSDQLAEAVSAEGMRDFEITMPEGDLFLLLEGKLGVTARRFAFPMKPVKLTAFSLASRHALAWPDNAKPVAFLPDDDRASLVIKDIESDFTGMKLEGSSWQNGVQLYGMWMSARLNPRDAGRRNHTVITNSFTTHLLTPLTAFLSPENDAQRQTLLRKQEQMLSSMRPLDVGEEHEMDEPPLWVLTLFLVTLFFLKRGKGWLPRTERQH